MLGAVCCTLMTECWVLMTEFWVLRTDRGRADELPPDYSATSKFTIAGETFRTPLVQVSHLKAHLNFLRAIRDLKFVIEAGQDSRIPVDALKLEASQRWAWFVGLAVERKVGFRLTALSPHLDRRV